MSGTRDIGSLIQDFTCLGLDPTGLRITVVMGGSPEAETSKIANHNRMAAADGAVNQDILSLRDYHRIPIYSFQPGLEWKPLVGISARSSHKA